MLMNPIKIVLAEDHTLVRAGIKMLLQNIEGMQVVAEANDGQEAIEHIKNLKPDVVLMDITMPVLNGLEAARLARQYHEVKVVMLSMHASEEYVWQALRAGALGYLLKDSGIAELELAVRAVANGQSYFSPAVSKHIVANYLQRVGMEVSPLERLTSRQRQILQLIAEGHTTKQIAEKLNVSIKTTETHRSQLMDQLNIHDISGLVRYAIRTGLVTSDE
jgi:DNA-binding NarL/FixJ family response regulator